MLGAGPERDLSPLSGHLEAATEQESFSNKGEQLPGILVVISRLNNLPMSAEMPENKIQNHKCVLSFPIWCIPAKQNNIIRTYVEFLKASNSSVISGCEVKAYCPSSLYENGVRVLPTCS